MIYISSGIVVALFFITWFMVCVHHQNYGLVDIAWGLGMAFLAGILIIFFKPNFQVAISLGLIVIWGLRLGIYLGKRNWGKPEDYRYQQLRKAWGEAHPLRKAFVNVFLLQGVLLYIMMFSSMNAISHQTTQNNVSLVLGVMTAVFGLTFEIVGDWQLKKFKDDPSNKGKLMTQGLWAVTRHPNYFGEVVFWWGVFLTSFQSLASVFGVVSPLLITILINVISGIPLLERKYADRADYQKYAAMTPRFIPLIGTKKIRT